MAILIVHSSQNEILRMITQTLLHLQI